VVESSRNNNVSFDLRETLVQHFRRGKVWSTLDGKHSQSLGRMESV